MGGFDLTSLLGGPSNPAALVGPGLSILGSLFGRRRDPRDDPNYQAAMAAAGRQADVAGDYSDLAGQAGEDLAHYRPGYNDAVDSYARYLQQDPGTSAHDASYLASATAGEDAANKAAEAGLTTNLLSRGITDGSDLTGGLTDLAAREAGQGTGAQIGLAQYKIAQANQDRQALVGLLGGAASQARGADMSALSGEGGANQSAFGDYNNLQQQDAQRQAAQDAQQNQLLSSIGAGVADAYDSPSDLEDAQTAYYNAAAKNMIPLGMGAGIAPGPARPGYTLPAGIGGDSQAQAEPGYGSYGNPSFGAQPAYSAPAAGGGGQGDDEEEGDGKSAALTVSPLRAYARRYKTYGA